MPGGAIRVGTVPPTLFEIESPPSYLPSLFEVLSAPVTVDDAVDFVARRHPEARPDEVRACLEDLVQLGVVHVAVPEGRYHRHELYFDFFDVPAGVSSKRLAACKVGLIGTGGIGSTCAMLLAAAGVGRLVISDGDLVEESNLTRTVLFEEVDVGVPKVDAARRRLLARNKDVRVDLVPRLLDGPDMLREHFAGCDAWILSADIPEGVHAWTNEVAVELGIPYLNAGYVDLLGVAGPFVVPGVTACTTCADLGDGAERGAEQLNRRLQAPSYGPLNALVAAIAVNEVLRHLLGLTVRTAGARLLIDSSGYRVSFDEVKPAPGCSCGAPAPRAPAPSGADRFADLAENYRRFRESSSLNALVLDHVIVDLVCSGSGLRILDVGCGIGTLSLAFARRGHRVTAVDVSPAMLEELRRRLSPDLVGLVTLVEGDAATLSFATGFDRVVLNLILDHIEDPAPLLARVRGILAPGGEVVVVVPHPLKDAGKWHRELIGGQWRYEHLVLRDYFVEGPIEKSREDDRGNIVIPRIVSQRRTISTYFSMLVRAGLAVEEVLEPRPPEGTDPCSVSYQKTSSVPYFLVFRCVARAGA